MTTGICPVGDHPFEYEVKQGGQRIYCSDAHMWSASSQRQAAKKALLLRRTCSRCKVEKPSENFGGPTAPYCRPCANEYERERRKINGGQDPGYTRMLNLRRYGLTPEQFADMVGAQDGRCAICQTTEPGGLGWHVDHDHTCCNTRKTSCGKCLRGLLCSRCNIALGNFRDNPATIQAAIEYIEAYRLRRLQLDGLPVEQPEQ